jgi:hypothetical protein
MKFHVKQSNEASRRMRSGCDDEGGPIQGQSHCGNDWRVPSSVRASQWSAALLRTRVKGSLDAPRCACSSPVVSQIFAGNDPGPIPESSSEGDRTSQYHVKSNLGLADLTALTKNLISISMDKDKG